MNIEKTKDGQFAMVQGARRIVLTKNQYEDVFYSVPLDNGQFFRLVNDTVLGTDELRVTFRAMVTDAGGIEAGMEALQKAVQAVNP